MTPTSVSILLAVIREGQMRLSEIAQAEGINPTMLSRVIAELVESGLLARTSDEHDRRAAWVKATPAGRRLADKMRRERTDALALALGALDASHRRQLEAALPALEELAQELNERRRP